jgi:hypothetical protein
MVGMGELGLIIDELTSVGGYYDGADSIKPDFYEIHM